jgi:Predicted periplasmic lipoprotein (DUF2279)
MAAGFSIALLAAPAALTAAEFRLFAEAARPRYALAPSDDDDALRLVDLEHSYPWSGGESLELGVVEQDPQETPKPAEAPPAPETVSPPPPKKLFDTTTTLWTAAALLGGVGQAIGAPIKYGTNPWHFTDEKYFQYDTYAGGADKASHFIVSSGVSRLLYDIYIQDGHTVDQSFWLAFATTLTAGIFVETGDAVTVYGFSWQDLSADFLGDLSGLLIHRFHLQDTIGLRLGPGDTDIPPEVIGSSQPSLGDTYANEIYLVDLKLGGAITRLGGSPGFSRYFLVSFAYFTKGFGYEPPLPTRYQEAGVELGINFPAILDDLKVPKEKWWGQGLYAFFNFFRIPYTQIGTYYNFKTKKWYGPSAPYHYY